MVDEFGDFPLSNCTFGIRALVGSVHELVSARTMRYRRGNVTHWNAKCAHRCSKSRASESAGMVHGGVQRYPRRRVVDRGVPF